MPDHFSTKSVHSGEPKHKPFGAITTPIIQASTYTFSNSAEIHDYMESKADGSRPSRDEYGRYSNPTQRIAENKLAELDSGEQALLFASGMCAITTTMLTLLSAGDHIILISDSYHRTREFATTFLSRWGIEVTLAQIDQPELIESCLKPNTRLVFAETPTNPFLRVMDIPKLVELAERHNFITMIDSTFSTPINLRPLELGVNLVVHSATKYLGGHNDLLAGVVIGSSFILGQIEKARGILGGISNPNDAYLLIRGLKTLALRVKRQNENGLKVAQYLEGHPAIERVYYPGLRSHPDYEVARRDLEGFGGVVSFEIKGDYSKAGHFIDLLHLPYIGPTLGGVESIIEQPAALFSLDPEERTKARITDNLIRYALGIEDVDDIISDLDQALSQMG